MTQPAESGLALFGAGSLSDDAIGRLGELSTSALAFGDRTASKTLSRRWTAINPEIPLAFAPAVRRHHHSDRQPRRRIHAVPA